jgi:hypothetical protein
MGREWGGDGKGEVSLRVTWGQGGQDHITPKEGFQVSKREWKGSNKELARGVKTRGLRHKYVVNLYICTVGAMGLARRRGKMHFFESI